MGVNLRELLIKHKIDMNVLVTLFEADNTVSKAVLNQIRSKYQDHLFNTMIEKDQMIQESQIVHTPVIFYNQNSIAGRQYQQLADEVEARYSSSSNQARMSSYR